MSNAFEGVGTEPQIKEVILPNDNCELECVGTRVKYWAHKDENGNKIVDSSGGAIEGKRTKVIEFSWKPIGDGAVCENRDAIPWPIKDDVPVENHPYFDKTTGAVKKMGVEKLHQLEAALGFDPVCQDRTSGDAVEAKVSAKTGRKYCPNGARQLVNPNFAEGYFDNLREPRFGAFEGQKVFAKVDVRTFNDVQSNEIKAYKPKVD